MLQRQWRSKRMSLIDFSNPFVGLNHGQKKTRSQKNHLGKVGFVGEKRGLNFENTIKTKAGKILSNFSRFTT